MRLALFNKGRLGLVDGDDLIDVTGQVAGTDAAGPVGALHRYVETVADEGTVRFDLAGRPRIPLTEAALEAPLPRPGKIVGAPVNYLDHKAEMEYTTSIADLGVFLKANSSVIGPGEDILLPYSDRRTDQEGELGVVIGRTASHVSTDAAPGPRLRLHLRPGHHRPLLRGPLHPQILRHLHPPRSTTSVRYATRRTAGGPC
ncbi:fumarylacetoacetate hydrolase family protein [Streptomyces sp. NPDC096191]|uniref:fumarylacetoacetate hydrolase family protein n=1 Tax=Streptomyces sp. NPDC096191 TaxID=3155426 RepID=UPI0033210FEB